MSAAYLVNGSPDLAPEPADRGFLYGDGLFETIYVRQGRAPLWARHFNRFRRDAARLGMPLPDEPSFLRDLERLRTLTGLDDAALRLQWTAGPGGRGNLRPEPMKPTRISAMMPLPSHPQSCWQEGVGLHLCELRLSDQPALAGIKHCNRLEYVLARQEWSDPGLAEGLLRDGHGRVIEGTISNAFAVRDGGLYTPALTRCGVQGVMRETVMALAETLGLPVEVGDFSLGFWQAADELFVTNSLIGIWPVRELAGRRMDPGPVTRLLQNVLRNDAVAWMP